MSGIVYACITPHGGPIIGEIAGNEFESFAPLRAGMEELGRRLQAHQPDTIVLLTPHGLRLQGHVAVYTSAFTSGSLAGGGNRVHARAECDQELAQAILKSAVETGIPTVGCNYGALSGPASDVQMDWGTLIPLWFFGAREQATPKVVIIGPTREIPLEQLVTLGELIADEAKKSGKRVAFVASADQAHAHIADGPYGFDPAAAEYDRQMCEIIRENRLADLLKMDMALVDKAKPDSLWQTLSLYGASKLVPMRGELLTYHLPSYYGMLVASYEVVDK